MILNMSNCFENQTTDDVLDMLFNECDGILRNEKPQKDILAEVTDHTFGMDFTNLQTIVPSNFDFPTPQIFNETSTIFHIVEDTHTNTYSDSSSGFSSASSPESNTTIESTDSPHVDNELFQLNGEATEISTPNIEETPVNFSEVLNQLSSDNVNQVSAVFPPSQTTETSHSSSPSLDHNYSVPVHCNGFQTLDLGMLTEHDLTLPSDSQEFMADSNRSSTEYSVTDMPEIADLFGLNVQPMEDENVHEVPGETNLSQGLPFTVQDLGKPTGSEQDDDLGIELAEEVTEADSDDSTENKQQSLRLTDEERAILVKEGYAIPSQLPLTKSEEKALRLVRRKIRNKDSARNSRRRKQEYTEGLEKRIVNYTEENTELKKRIEEMELQNKSLLSQLRRLQSMVSGGMITRGKGRTFLMVTLLSFALFIVPGWWSSLSMDNPMETLPRPFPMAGRSRSLLQAPNEDVNIFAHGRTATPAPVLKENSQQEDLAASFDTESVDLTMTEEQDEPLENELETAEKRISPQRENVAAGVPSVAGIAGEKKVSFDDSADDSKLPNETVEYTTDEPLHDVRIYVPASGIASVHKDEV